MSLFIAAVVLAILIAFAVIGGVVAVAATIRWRAAQQEMSHEEAFQLLADYARPGRPDLDKVTIRRIHKHLEECGECQEEYYFLKYLQNLLKEAPGFHPPSEELVHLAMGLSLNGRQREVEGHVKHCRECARLVEKVKEIENRLADAPESHRRKIRQLLLRVRRRNTN